MTWTLIEQELLTVVPLTEEELVQIRALPEEERLALLRILYAFKPERGGLLSQMH